MYSRLKHYLTVVLLFIILFLVFSASGALPFATDPSEGVDPYTKYGTMLTLLMYILRILALVPLPITLSNFIGILVGNTHPDPPKLMMSPLFGPICFRVVTRGTYPELVKRNVQRNVELCSKVGLTNYIFEVVTDRPISLDESINVRELVVPSMYKTSRGALYKARALQYSLEDDVTVLNDSDWVVHLDEETLLTESSLAGVLNFIRAGQYEFGQGVITYASDSIVNWVTTLADLLRVGADYGTLRFTLGVLHKPVFSWKGSFIVANAGAEKKVSFDFGPEGSIAEDCFFALTAWKEGYKFGYVEGEMWEKSTFSVMDYIRQRKRWVQGISLTFLSNQIPFRYKLGISVMILSWVVMPVTSLNFILIPLFPIPVHPLLDLLFAFTGGVVLFLFILGAIKSFSIRRHGVLKCIVLCVLTIFIAPLTMVLESMGVVLAAISRRSYEFHIVRKDLETVLTIPV
ncbi:beta-1,4-mannosyltransferase egh-like [Haliotis rubra]|uniref:beta-1,4-mannosyltransferase egh-like n=1 Tax=Haliotis rubra TaxID=36100 RepID=UPI001EE57E23|nr:beta-1,4-mannosyltransferase egh-like [Haliotis rubra]XP_046579453.1 beta-1,4-mannosyltransferase egh-like [Haliotis rubra]